MVIIIDAFREIRKSIKRFFSLILLVMLAVAFLSGLRTTSPDMKYTASLYYHDQKLMDIRLISTLGFMEEDLEKVLSYDGVLCAEGSREIDLKLENLVVAVYSMPSEINLLYLTKGRLPSTNRECVIDGNLLDDLDLGIGDTITLSDPDNEEDDIGADIVSTKLEDYSYTIVGIADSPLFISVDRGTSNVGTGTVSACIYVPESEFDWDYYTSIYLLLEDTKDMDAYTDEYEDYTKDFAKEMEDFANALVNSRYEYLAAKRQKIIDMAMMQIGAIDIQNAVTDVNIGDIQTDDTGIDNGKAYVLTRSANEGYMSYKQDAEKMGDLAEVFPVIFYLVAALSCLTSITRMIEDHRGEIGTLKALGYGYGIISIKYIGYAFLASFTGGIIGLVWGCAIIPVLCFEAWKGQYSLPDLQIVFQADIYLLSVGIAVVAVTGTAFLASRVELMARPAALMRPRSPKAGKRVFLEKITFIWKRLKFTTKVSCRNLFRYKQRFWMTVIGIAGCTALLVFGFGLYDSLFTVIDKQFVDVTHYDAYLDTDSEIDDEKLESIDMVIGDFDIVSDHMKVFTDMVASFKEDDNILGTYIIAASDYYEFSKFVSIEHRTDDEEVVIPHNTAVASKNYAKALFTEKLADTYRIHKGDTVEVVMSDDTVIELEVLDIVENYVYNYIYMDFADIDAITQENINYNRFLIKYEDETDDDKIDELSAEFVALDGVSSYTRIDSVVDRFKNSLQAVNAAVGIIILAATALAFIVLYNLTNINITERTRELATLKVLGFTDTETTNYIYRENIVMTLIGIVFGLVLGKYLLVWLMTTVESSYMMFGRDVSVKSYMISAILTAVFSLFVNVIAHFSIQKIDMVESLKSVE